MSIPSETSGPASFSLKQINNNAQTNTYMVCHLNQQL